MDRADRLSGGMGVPLSPRQNAMFNKRKKKKNKAKYGNETLGNVTVDQCIGGEFRWQLASTLNFT